MISDEEIQKYINESMIEQLIQDLENNILHIMKFKNNKYPTEKNDSEWLDFTNFVCRRRCQRNNQTQDTK